MKKIKDEEFIAIWDKYKSATKVSRITGMSERQSHRRRRSLERRYGISLECFDIHKNHTPSGKINPSVINLEIENGVIIVFSDAHFIKDEDTTAFRALLSFIKQLKPFAVVNNGDAFDGSAISRFPAQQWLEHKSSVKDELDATDDHLTRIEQACKGITDKFYWPLGNHDARFEAKLAASVPEYRGIEGFHLKDWFPRWKPCWGIWVNNNTIIKHRWKNGEHATFNNVVKGGVNFITGHLHQLRITPFSDYNGRRYGVDCGTLADIYGDNFMYTESSPVNWHPGFVVLTFRNFELLPPELVEVWDDDHVAFRGHILDADSGEIA